MAITEASVAHETLLADLVTAAATDANALDLLFGVDNSVWEMYPELHAAANELLQAREHGPDLGLTQALLGRMRDAVKGPVTQDELEGIAAEAYGSTKAQGGYGPSDLADALEAAVNLYIVDMLDLDRVDHQTSASEIKEILDRTLGRPQEADWRQLPSARAQGNPPEVAVAVSAAIPSLRGALDKAVAELP